MSKIYKLTEQYQPKEEWFIKPKGIHGVGHAKRVLILQEVLAQLLCKEGLKLNQEALRWSAITHDLGRLNDDDDPIHGKRSAEWVTQNLGDRIPTSSVSTVCYLNEWHCIADKWIPEMTSELAILKDADALDRVRLGDFDSSKLRFDHTLKVMIPFAQDLFSRMNTL